VNLTLVVPNFRWSETNKDFLWDYIPYNLCLLAAKVRKNGTMVNIIDAYKEDLETSVFAKRVEKEKPDMVGITTMIDSQLGATLRAAKAVKAVSKKIQVVVGGVSPSMNADILIKAPEIDIIVKGEGEYLMNQITLGYSWHGIHQALPIQKLNELPLPAYDLIDLKSYINKPPIRKSVDAPCSYPYGRIITSRGCPYGCCFCQVEEIMGKRWRGRSVENVIEEISWLKKDYKIKSLIFDDDNLLYNEKRAKSLFQEMIRRGLTMPWSMIATSVIKMDDEMIGLMAKSGCKYIDVAIESGSRRVQREIIGKRIDLEDAKCVIQDAKEYGIFVAANFIIGFPGETWTEIRKTLKVAEYIDADYTKVFTATPLKHTRLWDMCVKGKCLKEGDSWREGQIETSEFTSKEITMIRAYEWDRINFSSTLKAKKIAGMMGVSLEELNRIRLETRRRVWGL